MKDGSMSMLLVRFLCILVNMHFILPDSWILCFFMMSADVLVLFECFRISMLLGLVESDNTPVLTRLDTDTGVGSMSNSFDTAIAGESFPQILTPTNERNPKIMFVNMVFLVS